jgi:hypothetical protein
MAAAKRIKPMQALRASRSNPFVLMFTVILLASGAAARAQGSADPATIDALVREFERAVFTHEYEGITQQPLDRLEQPVEVWIEQDGIPSATAAANTAIVRDAVAALRSRARLDIRLREREIEDGLRITFSSWAEVAAAAQMFGLSRPATRVCDWGSAYEGTVGLGGAMGVLERLGGSNVLVVADNDESFRRACVHRFLVSALGFRNPSIRGDVALAPSHVERGTIPEPTVTAFTGWDIVMVRMLYDTRLRKGMTLAEARPVLPRIAADAVGR